MPIIRVEMLAGRPQEVKQKMAEELTEVVTRNLGADPSHVYVMFADVAHEDWAVAGRFFPTQAPKGDAS